MIVLKARTVRAKMAERGLTDKTLAPEIGVVRESVTRAINGSREVTLSEAVAMSRLFDCRIEDLIEGDPSRRRPKGAGRPVTLPAAPARAADMGIVAA